MTYKVILTLTDCLDIIQFKCTGYSIGYPLMEFSLGKGKKKWFRTDMLVELTIEEIIDD